MAVMAVLVAMYISCQYYSSASYLAVVVGPAIVVYNPFGFSFLFFLFAAAILCATPLHVEEAPYYNDHLSADFCPPPRTGIVELQFRTKQLYKFLCCVLEYKVEQWATG